LHSIIASGDYKMIYKVTV